MGWEETAWVGTEEGEERDTRTRLPLRTRAFPVCRYIRTPSDRRDNPLAGLSHSGLVVPVGKRLGPLQFGSRFSGVAFLSGDGLGSFAGGVRCCGLGKTLSWLAGSDGTEGRKRGVYFVTTN